MEHVRTKKALPAAILAAALCLAALLPSAASAASKKAIQESDFVIPVGKKSINLLTDTPLTLEKKLGKSFDIIKNETEESLYFPLETTSATFYTWTDKLEEAGFITHVLLKKKTKTARGIQIGSSKKTLLNAYPAPLSTHESDDAHTVYVFGLPTPSEYWKQLEAQPSSTPPEKHPLFYYVLRVEVNKKSGLVTSILYDNQVSG